MVYCASRHSATTAPAVAGSAALPDAATAEVVGGSSSGNGVGLLPSALVAELAALVFVKLVRLLLDDAGLAARLLADEALGHWGGGSSEGVGAGGEGTCEGVDAAGAAAAAAWCSTRFPTTYKRSRTGIISSMSSAPFPSLSKSVNHRQHDL